MALVKCGECGKDVSDKAVACPNCGAPITVLVPSAISAAPAHQASAVPVRKKLGRRGLVAGAILLGIIMFVGYRAFLSEDERDAVNRVSSVVGLPVTPWKDRAQAAMRTMLAKEEQRGVIARSVLNSLHPTGVEPSVVSFDVSAMGDALITKVVVGWKGGVLGTRYKTVVTWKCTKTQNLGVELTSDDGPFGVGNPNLKSLSDWFRTQVYPVLLSNAG